MHIPTQLVSALQLDRPQVHSRKHHHVYNGSGRLPLATWVRSPTIITLDDPTDPAHCDINHILVYEVVLYFGSNRACTIYRSRADFERLRQTITPWKTGPPQCIPRDHNDAAVLHQLLREALLHRPRDCALEYFLRRRMEDCGGHRC
ncbi:uncharacterized protein B0I36DRAFT_362903 [Microdochium trichocladiopsis]|uniref:Uncharacterized protein n=1 Tax=Microdochium trichocladiopsis TaxID=1682393 RepID=A0A9P8Y6E0_9PEZI|nr:uncharacterized protein B0I36DRAFT_362903 [Microdochium trichocladiopsis]KAH7031166.1 hypothetical protein B0I36DRAFT_362903 [Microdochium trichocladiopsis]